MGKKDRNNNTAQQEQVQPGAETEELVEQAGTEAQIEGGEAGAEGQVTDQPGETTQTEGEAAPAGAEAAAADAPVEGADAAAPAEEAAPEVPPADDAAPAADEAAGADQAAAEEEQVDMTALEAAIHACEKSGVSTLAIAADNLKRYIAAMAPGKFLSPDEGARAQLLLWSTLKTIINTLSDADFRKAWNMVLMAFGEHSNGVFGERHVFRFSESWHQSHEELATFQAILNLIIATRDPETRNHGLKQIDLNRTLSHGITELGRQRVVTYYQGH